MFFTVCLSYELTLLIVEMAAAVKRASKNLYEMLHMHSITKPLLQIHTLLGVLDFV